MFSHGCEGDAAPVALHESKGGFSFAKETPPFETPRERLDIAGEQLEELQCLPIALPCARRCRVWICYTIWVTSTTRCRSADLVEVRTNFRLLGHSSMRRASAMPHSVGSLPPNATSHAPHDSKARLQNGDETHGFMAKPCTPHPIAQRVQSFKLQTRNVRGRGGRPLVPFSWGV